MYGYADNPIIDRISHIRFNLGFTQPGFALSLGMDANAIRKVENGLGMPTNELLERICQIHFVNPAWLHTGNGDMFSDARETANEARYYLQKLSAHSRDYILKTMEKLLQMEYDSEITAQKSTLLQNNGATRVHQIVFQSDIANDNDIEEFAKSLDE